MDAWIIWLVVAVVFGVGRGASTLSFYLFPFAIGAAGAALVALAGGGAVLTWPVFAVLTAVSFGVVRPIARRHLDMPPQIRTGTAALIGRTRDRARATSTTTRRRAACASTARSGAPAPTTRTSRSQGRPRAGDGDQGRDRARQRVGGTMAGLIVAAVLVALRGVPRRADGADHPAGQGGRRRAPRPLQPHAEPGPHDRRAVRGPGPPAAGPARAGRHLPAPAGHHRRQRQRRHRHRPVLHDHRRALGHLRDRQPAAGDRAAHGHDAAQHRRLADARAGADQPRRGQRPHCASCSTSARASGASASTASS